MKVEILGLLAGAINGVGVVVIIDVFRASNTIISALTNGVGEIYPVESIQKAIEKQRLMPEALLVGEKGGIKPKGFYFNNSPAILEKENISGEKMILATSSGAKGIVGAVNAEEVLIASFANANSIVSYINKNHFKDITLVPMGLDGVYPAVEDDLCAEFLRDLLLGRVPDFERIKEEILEGDGAKRLKKLGQEEDLRYCLKKDITNVIPIYDKKTGYITKI